MSKNIIWYSIEDGSTGGCKDTDLIIVDASDITAEEASALYQADADGDPQEYEDAIWAIHLRQKKEATVCGS